jgi:hypothetical protein
VIAVCTSATAVDAAQWAELSAGEEVRLDRPWFALQERQLIGARTLYLTLSQDGALRGIAPCLVTREDDNGFASYRPTDVLLRPEEIRGPDAAGVDRAPLEEARELLTSIRPLRSLSVVCPQSRYAPVGGLLGPADAELVAALDELAAREGAALWAILGVRESSPFFTDAERLGLLPALVSANAVLDAPWESFDGYLDSLPSHRRANVRRERASARKRGLVIAPEPDPVAHLPELGRLIDNRRRRYGRRAGRPLPLEEILDRYGENARVIGARREGRLVGFVLVLSRGAWHTVYASGSDYDATERHDFLYPNVSAYGALEDVVSRGGGRLSYGGSNYRAKLLRGCRLELSWALYRPLTRRLAGPLAAYLERFNALQAAHYLSLAELEVP